MLTATNTDVVVKLNEGEIVTTSCTNTDYGLFSDDAKLIFEKH